MSRYIEPMLNPGEEVRSCSSLTLRRSAKRWLRSGLAVSAVCVVTGLLTSGLGASIWPGLGILSLSVPYIAGPERDRAWLCVTSERVLCLHRPGPRGPRLLFAEPQGSLRLSRYERHTFMTSSVRVDLLDERHFTLRGGTGFTDQMDALIGADTA